MRQPGKAHKAAKAQRAAKHRANRHAIKRASRVRPRHPLRAPAPVLDPAELQGRVEAAFDFFRRNDLNPFVVLTELLEDHATGRWPFEGRNGDTLVVEPTVRHALIARLYTSLIKPAEKKAEPADEPKDVL